MALKQVMEFVEAPRPEHGLNLQALVAKDNQTEVLPPEPKKRGPGRPPRNSYNNANVYTDPDSIVKVNKGNNTPEAQYEKGYTITSKLLFGAIAQTEDIYRTVEGELEELRNHKAKGGKLRSQIMSEYMNTQMGLVNTKINAIRELNSIRHKVNDLVLKRLQADKEANDDNADKAVMDAYYALVNASNYGLPQMQAPLSPTTINTGVNLTGQRVQGTTINASDIITSSSLVEPRNNPIDASFEHYKANLTPIQRKMILDNDPNIKTVVVYDQSTGRKYFDVVNVSTGQSIPGVTRPGDFLLDNMRIDARNGIASNSNTNQSYPLVIVGTRVADEL